MGFGSYQWESAWNLGELWTMGVTLRVGLERSGFSPNPNSPLVSLFSPVSFLLCLGISVRVRVKWWDGSSMVYACVGCYLLVWCSSWSWRSGLVIWPSSFVAAIDDGYCGVMLPVLCVCVCVICGKSTLLCLEWGFYIWEQGRWWVGALSH